MLNLVCQIKSQENALKRWRNSRGVHPYSRQFCVLVFHLRVPCLHCKINFKWIGLHNFPYSINVEWLETSRQFDLNRSQTLDSWIKDCSIQIWLACSVDEPYGVPVYIKMNGNLDTISDHLLVYSTVWVPVFKIAIQWPCDTCIACTSNLFL